MDRLEFLTQQFLTQWEKNETARAKRDTGAPTPSIAPRAMLNFILACDPTATATRPPDRPAVDGLSEPPTVHKAGAYSEWLIRLAWSYFATRQHSAGEMKGWIRIFEEDGEKIRSDLDVFHRKKGRIPKPGQMPEDLENEGIKPKDLTRDINKVRDLEHLRALAKFLSRFVTQKENRGMHLTTTLISR